MKKVFFILTSVCFMAACNNSSTSTDGTDTSATSTDTASSTMSSPATTDTASASTTAMKDGVMTLKDGKLVAMKGGSWEPVTEDVTCTNGVKVSTKGEMTKGGKSKTLTEGMMIDKDGQLTDASGSLVDNAGW